MLKKRAESQPPNRLYRTTVHAPSGETGDPNYCLKPPYPSGRDRRSGAKPLTMVYYTLLPYLGEDHNLANPPLARGLNPMRPTCLLMSTSSKRFHGAK